MHRVLEYCVGGLCWDCCYEKQEFGELRRKGNGWEMESGGRHTIEKRERYKEQIE